MGVLSYRDAIALAIREARQDMGWDQPTLGRVAGVSRGVISNIESPTRAHWPNLATVHHMALSMGLKPSELMARAEELQAEYAEFAHGEAAE